MPARLYGLICQKTLSSQWAVWIPRSNVLSLLYTDMGTQSLWPCNDPKAIFQMNSYLQNGMAMLPNPKDLPSDSFTRSCQSLSMCQRHIRCHKISFIPRPKWQHSLQNHLPQRLLLLWDPLKTGSFLSHSTNDSDDVTE